MDGWIIRAFSAFFLGLLITVSSNRSDGKVSGSLCSEKEKQALLRFKSDLTDPSGRLSSWDVDHQKDCCQWVGVSCDNYTGHVRELHLQNPDAYSSGGLIGFYEKSSLGGKINPSLLVLERLSHLDLSYNNFEGLQIPGFISSLTNLQTLDLSKAGFGGLIPQQLGNLSSLASLRLKGHGKAIDDYTGSSLSVEDLQWVSNLRMLKDLDLSFVNLSKASDWVEKINMLPSLNELYLAGCNLNSHASLLTIINNFSSSLSTIDLSYNNFGPSLPHWIFGITSLKSLSLSQVGISGPIPASLRNMTNLQNLDLSSNLLDSSIPHELCELSCLQILDLSNNKLSGNIPKCVNNLSAMTKVLTDSIRTPISYAYYGGEIAILENAFLVTKGLEFRYDSILALMTIMDLSNNVLSGKIPEELSSLKGLRALNLSRNHLSGVIPINISNMGLVESLDLSTNQLSGKIPATIASLTFLSYFNVSFNELSGEIPKSTQLQSFNASSFVGNKLCGPPLQNDCIDNTTEDGKSTDHHRRRENDDENESKEVYISMLIGCVVGFWGLFGPLLYSDSWRRTYFRFLDVTWCRVYVYVMRWFRCY